MFHGLQRYSRYARTTPLRLVRRLMRCRPKPWCESLVLLITIALTCTWLRAEIGNWLALLTAAGAPLAALDGAWSRRFIARRARQQLRRLLGEQSPAVPDTDHAPVFLLSPMPAGYGIFLPEPVDGAAPRMPALWIGRSQHCVLFAVDIAEITDPGRDEEIRLAVRDALHRLLIDAFEGAGISWRSCVREDRDKGVVVVIPAHMPTIRVVDPLVHEIRLRLARHNRLSSPAAQLRLRLAVHIGEVHRDERGPAGTAVNHLLRILDAPDLRQALRSSDSGLALIVSDYVYWNVIYGGPGGVNPVAYSKITMGAEQFQAPAWILEVAALG
jgi:hypothetical protein